MTDGNRKDIRFREEPRPADVDEVRTIVASTGFFSDDEIGVAAELVETRLRDGEASGYLFLFAEREGKVLGYGCYGEIPCTRGSWDLYWIAVREEARGLGLGTEILLRIEEIVRRAGGRHLYAETAGKERYASTRAFYERRGYEAAAVLDDFYAPGDAKFLYRKILAPSSP